MKKAFFIIFLILTNFFFHCSYSQIFIVSKVNNEIITNYDIITEKKYLLALNPSLKKFDEKDLEIYAKKSLINEKVKKIEIEKYIKIPEDSTLLQKVINQIYSGLNLKSLDEFKQYLSENQIDLSQVNQKILIEIAWNDLIVNKFGNDINIDIESFKKKISEQKTSETVLNLQISEIVFTTDNNQNLQDKFKILEESIKNIGFNETAKIYSISSSKTSGGNIGWVYKQQLSETVQKKISALNIGEYSKPIVTPGGFVIIQLNDAKEETAEINENEQLKKMIDFERDRQLNRFSNLYYKRIFNSTTIDEK